MFRNALAALTFALGPLAWAQEATTHAPDGGVHQTLISISVPMLTGSPFTATVETEWIHILPDGTTATIRNRRTIARDSSGRVFEERRFFTPDQAQQPRLQALQYRDPNRHEFTNCQVQQHICFVSRLLAPALTQMPAASLRPLPGNVKEEPLGERTEQGLNLVGTREITTLPAGAVGNSRPEPIVKEFWYSPLLGVNVMTKRFDPRNGAQNFQVTNISRNEPDAKIFQLPSGYRIVRMPTAGQGSEVTP